MKAYKIRLMLKGLPFLDGILRKQDDSVYKKEGEVEEARKRLTDFYGRNLGFQIDEDDMYLRASSLENPDSINVKRGDDSLLSETPWFDAYSWSGGGHYDHKSYFVITDDGNTVRLDESGESKTGSGDHEEQSAPNIGEQLMLMKINPEFIVCYDFQDTDDNGNGKTNLAITIHKMKNFNLLDFYCQEIDRAAVALKAEITAVCKGGGK